MDKKEIYNRLLDLAFVEMLNHTHIDDVPKRTKRFDKIKANITDEDLDNVISDVRAKFDW